MRFYNYIFLSAILMIAAAFGCSKIVDLKQKDTFSQVSEAYRKAILWSDFGYASTFVKKDHQNSYQLDSTYQNIKVTGYDEIHAMVNTDISRIEQTVHIHYYRIDQMVEKRITDHPVWQWDEKAGNWHLISGLPCFE
ncbi:MAG: hypothetical protein R6U27_17535 [Desulfobacterales bacterium]